MAVTQQCPTAIFGQLELALRDNEFLEVERLRRILASMGVHIHIDLWTADTPPANETNFNRNGRGSAQ